MACDATHASTGHGTVRAATLYTAVIYGYTHAWSRQRVLDATTLCIRGKEPWYPFWGGCRRLYTAKKTQRTLSLLVDEF